MPVARYRFVPMQYACQIFRTKFYKLDSLKRHHRDKHVAKIQCEFCPYSVARSRGRELERHMATKHSFPVPVRTVGENFFLPGILTPTTGSYTLEEEVEEMERQTRTHQWRQVRWKKKTRKEKLERRTRKR